MSNAALKWAFSVQLKPVPKLILLALANRHNDKTGLCYPSISTICQDTGHCRNSVKNALKTLSNIGLVDVLHRTKKSKLKTSSQYNLKIGNDPIPSYGSRAGDDLGSRAGDDLGSRAGDDLGGRAGDDLGGRAGDDLGGRAGDDLGGRAGDDLGGRAGDDLGGRALAAKGQEMPQGRAGDAPKPLTELSLIQEEIDNTPEQAQGQAQGQAQAQAGTHVPSGDRARDWEYAPQRIDGLDVDNPFGDCDGDWEYDGVSYNA